MRKKAISVIFIFIFAQAAHADDWLMPGNGGVGAENQSVEPPLELLWKFDTSSSVGSIPTVSEGVLYAGSGNYVYALDSNTGNVLWKSAVSRDSHGGITSSPVVSSGMIYAASADDYILALNASNGNLKWKFPASSYGNPVVSGDTVYVTYYDFLIALDAGTGKIKWESKGIDPYNRNGGGDFEGSLHASTALSEGMLYVGSTERAYVFDESLGMAGETKQVLKDYLYAFDAGTGYIQWKYQTGDRISAPSVLSGVVYTGSLDNFIYALDAGTGNLKWKYKTAGNVTLPPVVSEGTVYAVSETTQDAFSQSIGYALDAGTGRLKFKWDYKPGYPGFLVGFATSGDTVYLSSVYNLSALDMRSNSEKWRYKFTERITSPVISGGRVYIGSGDGFVYAFASYPYLVEAVKKAARDAEIIGVKDAGVDEILAQAELALKNRDYAKVKELTATANSKIDDERKEYYRQAREMAENATVTAGDMQNEYNRTANDRDFAPSINNNYIYAGALLSGIALAGIQRWKKHRLLAEKKQEILNKISEVAGKEV